jgi:hypothetical protein
MADLQYSAYLTEALPFHIHINASRLVSFDFSPDRFSTV